MQCLLEEREMKSQVHKIGRPPPPQLIDGQLNTSFLFFKYPHFCVKIPKCTHGCPACDRKLNYHLRAMNAKGQSKSFRGFKLRRSGFRVISQAGHVSSWL
eukprot:1032798-Pleurochrysis_carterae.AAC.4